MFRLIARLAKPTLFAAVLASATVGASVAACSDGDGAVRTCTVNADCASGQCRSDGTCAPVGDGEAGPAPEGDAGHDAAPDHDTGTLPLLDSGLCTANNDGVITAAEVPLRAGLKGTFKVTTANVTISTAGIAVDGGSFDAGSPRSWDFSAALTGDHSLIVETMGLGGQWFEPDYPGAAYAVRLSDSVDFLGVFATTAGALELRGVVSPASGSSQTKITYDPPVPTLAFPLQKGKTWTVETTASGDIPPTFNVPYTEEYTFVVDAEGELKTSSALNAFKVLRIAVLLKKTPAGFLYGYYTRQYVYVAECFGSIAKVVSTVDQLSEPEEEFTEASEVQRLAP